DSIREVRWGRSIQSTAHRPRGRGAESGMMRPVESSARAPLQNRTAAHQVGEIVIGLGRALIHIARAGGTALLQRGGGPIGPFGQWTRSVGRPVTNQELAIGFFRPRQECPNGAS